MAEANKNLVNTTDDGPIATSFQGLGNMPIFRQLGVMIGLAASVAVGVAVVLWAQTPTYSVLYGGLSDKDANQIMESLQQQSISYKMDESTGAVMVPSRELHKARLKLASDGLPKGSSAGFEMLDSEEGFGTSQFMENARYYRAIEVELARSIMTLSNVENARVHLAVPKRSVFARKREKPSASVLVDLYPGRLLDEGQVEAVTHMIASSVPNLEASNVTVVDHKGRLLTNKQQSGEMAVSKDQFEYTRKLEKLYTGRITNILAPLVGVEGIRAQVVCDIDFTVTEQTQELFNPESPAIRSEQNFVEEILAAGNAGGVPGATSNQPPGASSVPETGATNYSNPNNGNQATKANRRKTANYELDKTISHTRTAPGTLKRLSVAVVIDDRLAPDGKRVQHTPEDIDRITNLVKEAVGFKIQRGDSVSVINASFKTPEEIEPLPEPGIFEQAWVWDVAKQVLGGMVVLILIFGILRPVMRSLIEKADMIPVQRAAAAYAGPGGQLAIPTDEESRQLLKSSANFDNQVKEVKTVVDKNPELVANVVKQWVAADE
jgi:flagellar M-ring protein FliF